MPSGLRVGTHAFLDWLSRRGRWLLSYSVGLTITDTIHQAHRRPLRH
ncbi:hypothetical protein [Streptomyces sp. NPDC048669]